MLLFLMPILLLLPSYGDGGSDLGGSKLSREPSPLPKEQVRGNILNVIVVDRERVDLKILMTVIGHIVVTPIILYTYLQSV